MKKNKGKQMSQNSFSALSLSEYTPFIEALYNVADQAFQLYTESVGLFSAAYELIHAAICPRAF